MTAPPRLLALAVDLRAPTVHRRDPKTETDCTPDGQADLTAPMAPRTQARTTEAIALTVGWSAG